MARLSKKLVLVQIRVAPEQRRRLEGHARRLGLNMVDIVRQAMLDRLDYLDEKAAIAEERKRLEKQRAQDSARPGRVRLAGVASLSRTPRGESLRTLKTLPGLSEQRDTSGSTTGESDVALAADDGDRERQVLEAAPAGESAAEAADADFYDYMRRDAAARKPRDYE